MKKKNCLTVLLAALALAGRSEDSPGFDDYRNSLGTVLVGDDPTVLIGSPATRLTSSRNWQVRGRKRRHILAREFR